MFENFCFQQPGVTGSFQSCAGAVIKYVSPYLILIFVIRKYFQEPLYLLLQLYAEKVATRGLCAIAQAESLRYKLIGGLAVRRWDSKWMFWIERWNYIWVGLCKKDVTPLLELHLRCTHLSIRTAQISTLRQAHVFVDPSSWILDSQRHGYWWLGILDKFACFLSTHLSSRGPSGRFFFFIFQNSRIYIQENCIWNWCPLNGHPFWLKPHLKFVLHKLNPYGTRIILGMGWVGSAMLRLHYRLVSNIRRTSSIRRTPIFGNSQLKFSPTISLAKTSQYKTHPGFWFLSVYCWQSVK